MQETGQHPAMHVHVLSLRQDGHLLRLRPVPSVPEAIAGRLLPAGGGEDLRPQLRGLRQGLGTVK